VLPELRDGKNAVRLAQKALAEKERKDANSLDTLAAAYAEAGDFAKAVDVEKEALALVETEDEKKDFSARQKLYESNTPYRDTGD
jgi:hypothetical protein